MFMWMWPANWVPESHKERTVPIICQCEIQCFQCHHSDLEFYKLVSTCYRNILFNLVVSTGSGLWPGFQSPRCPEQQRILPVWWTLVSIKIKFQWFLKILQAQIKRWKYKAHSVPTIYKSATIFCAMHIYALYQKAQ